jgi:pSer/pThr/pTyr-binding forkhead associated (FHA) protein
MEVKNHLDHIEARLRQVVETWIVPFQNSNFHQRLAHLLVEAMREKIYRTDDGRYFAPHLFTIRLNPSLVHELQGSSLLSDIPEELRLAAQSASLSFLEPPELRLEPVDRFTLDDIEVHTREVQRSLGNTAVLRLAGPADPPRSADRPGSAFLILGGEQVYPLSLPVINLGRRPDNHVVIDDARISRNHAQIRTNRGQHILFDLNSTGGTSVNGLRIRQHALKPGDVISLAGVALIYGEEPPSQNDAADSTQVMHTPPPPEELI